MNNKKLVMYLIASISILTLSSAVANYFLLDEMLESSIRIGVNNKTTSIMIRYQEDLKKLKVYDQENADAYKQKFYEIQEAMIVFKSPESIAKLIQKSYLYYYLILFLSIVLVSLSIAIWLARRVAQSHSKLLLENLTQQNRLHDLENFEIWKELASMLAHEIKNPLTPIEMMVSNLSTNCPKIKDKTFLNQLAITEKVVLEEVNRLKLMIEHFSRFSRLPDPVLKEMEFIQFIYNAICDYATTNKKLELTFKHKYIQAIWLEIDPLLIKQCLLNLISNAEESNKNLNKISLHIELSITQELVVRFSNDGRSLNDVERSQLFNFGYTTKSNSENHGIGLAVVRNIILKHGGDIVSIPFSGGTAFDIHLPFKKVIYVSG